MLINQFCTKILLCFFISDLLKDKDVLNVDNIKTVYIDPAEKEEKEEAFLVLFAITCLKVDEEDRLQVAEKADLAKYRELKLLSVRDSWLYWVRGLYNSHFKVSKEEHLFKLLLDDLPSLYRDSVIEHCHDVLGEALNECLFNGVERILVLNKEYIVPTRSCIFFGFSEISLAFIVLCVVL